MQRKYLIIAVDTKSTAPGIVFKTLVSALSVEASCVLITSEADSSMFPESVEIVKCPQYVPYSWNAAKKRWRQFHFSPKDEKWWRSAYRSVIGKLRGYTFDAVLSFTSMGYFPPIQLGRHLADKYSAKWAIYSVDGIPSPIGWIDDGKVHVLMSRFLDRACRNSNIFFSSNPFMMEYEKKVLNSFRGKWDYIFTPILNDYSLPGQDSKQRPNDGTVFLYAGSIYGLRKIDGLISGFRKYLAEVRNSRLIFVGDIPKTYFSSDLDLITRGCVELHPYTSDLHEYYKQADVLVDIAADIPDDIFLSSKIISYLPIGKPILAVSGKNSPARNIFEKMNSICHCYNDSEEIFNCMCNITSCRNFEDRMKFIDMFSPETSVKKLVCQLDALV